MISSLPKLLRDLKQLGSEERDLWDQNYHKSQRESIGAFPHQHVLSLLAHSPSNLALKTFYLYHKLFGKLISLIP